MNTKVNSINQNGCSVCAKGEENYTTFRPAHRPNAVYYQYDYRHNDNDLFSCVAPTLAACREKRDKWVQAKNYKKIYPSILKRIEDGKRLTKIEMSSQIGHVEPYHHVSIYWDTSMRDEIVEMFNKLFGTSIQ